MKNRFIGKARFGLIGGIAGFAFLAPLLFTASAIAGEIRVRNATANLLDTETNGYRIEIYMDIENSGDHDRLYAVRTGIAENAMLSVVGDGMHGGEEHSDANKGETAHNQTMALNIPPGQTVRLNKGQSHIMLMNPEKLPPADASFPVTLFFEHAGRVTVDVTMQASDMAATRSH